MDLAGSLMALGDGLEARAGCEADAECESAVLSSFKPTRALSVEGCRSRRPCNLYLNRCADAVLSSNRYDRSRTHGTSQGAADHGSRICCGIHKPAAGRDGKANHTPSPMGTAAEWQASGGVSARSRSGPCLTPETSGVRNRKTPAGVVTGPVRQAPQHARRYARRLAGKR